MSIVKSCTFQVRQAPLIAALMIVCSVGTMTLAGEPPSSARSERADPIARHLRYRFTVRNTTNQTVHAAEFWAYAPAPQTATQQRINLKVSQPFQEASDPLGNSILHLQLPDLPAYATTMITIEADLALAEVPQPSAGQNFPDAADSSYLRPEPYCESDDPAIIELARKLAQPDPRRTAEAIFRWVAANVSDSGYLRDPRGARYALTHKQGDCTEFMYLFVALCRAAGIPARGVGGYITDRNAILKAEAYHNWAEFYADGVWRIADPQRKVFMEDQWHYLVMNIVGDPSANPMGHYQRFRFTGDGLKVEMN